MGDWFERLAVIVLIVASLQAPFARHSTPSKGDNPNWELCGAEDCLCTQDVCSPWTGD